MSESIRRIVQERLLRFRSFLADVSIDEDVLKESTLSAIEEARMLEAGECADGAFIRARRLLQEAYESMRAGAPLLAPFGWISAKVRARFGRERADVAQVWALGSPLAMESMGRLVAGLTVAVMMSSGPVASAASVGGEANAYVAQRDVDGSVHDRPHADDLMVEPHREDLSLRATLPINGAAPAGGGGNIDVEDDGSIRLRRELTVWVGDERITGAHDGSTTVYCPTDSVVLWAPCSTYRTMVRPKTGDPSRDDRAEVRL